MTAWSYVTIWCDGGPDEPRASCGAQVEGDTAADARSLAHALGWRVAVPDPNESKARDYCPKHR